MIKTVHFNDFRGHSSIEQNDCIVLRRSDYVGATFINVAFPFHEDTPNFTLTVPEALTLRNVIDELVVVKMLGEPEPRRAVASDWAPSNINIPDSERIVRMLEDYSLDTPFDAGARYAVKRVIQILGLREEQ